ncbi:MAG: DUF3426 domain-containing protein [Lysobacteraceae bacterium]|nr:MAG: DUF3426 domain-containing protein [Xanthomonadaceae bacterium]
MAVIVVLALALCVQVVLADRESLAADARWRPAVTGACMVLRCEVPPWREPAALTLVRRDVRPLPGHPGVLHVSAEFRNDAVWPQAWPVLVLSLADVDGRTVGSRAFQPREYLGEAPTQSTLASGHSARIEMDLVEPAPGVVAFTFDFR